MGFQSIEKGDPGFVNLTRDVFKGDMVGLFEAGEAVESLLAQPGWAVVENLVALAVAGIDRRFEGPPLEAAEYARYGGCRRGLRGFQEAAHAIVSYAEKVRTEQAMRHEGVAESAPIGA